MITSYQNTLKNDIHELYIRIRNRLRKLFRITIFSIFVNEAKEKPNSRRAEGQGQRIKQKQYKTTIMISVLWAPTNIIQTDTIGIIEIILN